MGGILALALAFGIVFGARKLCSLIGAPLWFARFLFVCAALGVTYLLAEAVVPDSKKPWGVWLAMLGAASGIIPRRFYYVQTHRRRRRRQQKSRGLASIPLRVGPINIATNRTSGSYRNRRGWWAPKITC